MFGLKEHKKLIERKKELMREERKHNEPWGWGDLAVADSSVYMCGCIPYVFTFSMFQLTSCGAYQIGDVVIINVLIKGKTQSFITRVTEQRLGR